MNTSRLRLKSSSLPAALVIGLLALPLVFGCSNGDGGGADGVSDAGDGDGDGDGDAGDGDGDAIETATFTHMFGERSLGAYEEVTDCVSWTLNNDKPLYVQAVTQSNLGFFHHSNWFVVPEDLYPGDDGYWKCSDRGFSELAAAASGTVIFAQSTQSFVETQRTKTGAVIKIPPKHTIVAGAHMLNASPQPVDTNLFMTLEVLHPRHVETILAPFRLSYLDLDIPAMSESRFKGNCGDLAESVTGFTDEPFELKLHYVLPHYHYLGNYFSLEMHGGELDGQTVYELDGFNGEANGLTFDPPLDLTGIDGFTFTCGYDNFRDVNVGWGIGDQEMCVMLGLAESDVLIDASVTAGTSAIGMDGEIIEFGGNCGYIVINKNASQSPPTQAEIDGDLYTPPVDPADADIPPIPQCEDADPEATSTIEATLTNVKEGVFTPSCSFSGCHGAAAQAAGLDLQSEGLAARLMDHQVKANTSMPLVAPGDPEGSWLYQRVSRCAPVDDNGTALPNMPLNAPVLLQDEAVALVRQWIEAGALDN